ncbi:MAG: L-serine ammonia-lyase, iron-sulfur-dependent, subunit alpha [Oscillospiraceae bacterium]|jgi:L-cysteine desulfidase|nr:L-serine ammonia-lyase, iron-sulfur-dependent, subunit alpha [Oscillospiraceae bacterium]
MNKQKVIDILNSEMELATGCTEPAAIAFTAAVAAHHLNGEKVKSIHTLASGNMIKNAMAAGIPGTHYTGMEYAAAIGAIGGNPEKKLQVITGVDSSVYSKAQELVQSGSVTVEVAHTSEKLYVDIQVQGEKHSAKAVISGAHTNVVLIQEDGKTVFENKGKTTSAAGIGPEEIHRTLSVQKIYEFVGKMDPVNDPLDIIRQSISVNTAISEEGLKNDYGLKIGKALREEKEKGIVGDDMVTNAVTVTTAAADARMAGAPFAVVSNSGSGNQGITTTMPVVAAAKWLKSGEDKMIRAVTLSNLVAIYIKSKFGRLSALCGATVAGTGAACGITYLLGGDLKAIEYAIQNMIGNVTGMLCDGAKADCALKISTCTNAAIQSAYMAMKGLRVQKTDGIVENDVEKSIDNFTALGNKGSAAMDSLVLNMMLHKEKNV